MYANLHAEFERLRAEHAGLEREFERLSGQHPIDRSAHAALKRRLAAYREALARWRLAAAARRDDAAGTDSYDLGRRDTPSVHKRGAALWCRCA